MTPLFSVAARTVLNLIQVDMIQPNEIDPRVLQKIKNQVLVRYRTVLCRKLAPEKYYPYLRQMKVFSIDDEQEVRCRVTPTERVSMLLDKLQRHDDGFDILLNILKSIREESHIVEYLEGVLNEMLQSEVNNYHGSITGSPVAADDDDLKGLPLPTL